MTETPAVSDATKAAFLLAADTMNRFALLAHADPGVDPELAAKIMEWQQNLAGCDWPILGYDTSDPPTEPANDSVAVLTYPENPVYTGGRSSDEYTMAILAEIREDKLCGDYLNGANRVTLHPDATLTQGDARFAQFATVAEAAAYLEQQGWHREKGD